MATSVAPSRGRAERWRRDSISLSALQACALREDPRHDAARRNRIDPNALAADLGLNAARELNHRGFERGVDMPRNASAKTRGAGDRDDTARALRNHDPRGVLHAEHHAANIRVKDRREMFAGD